MARESHYKRPAIEQSHNEAKKPRAENLAGEAAAELRIAALREALERRETGDSAGTLAQLEGIREVLQRVPFGFRPPDFQLAVKRQLFQLLPHLGQICAAADEHLRRAVASLVDALIRSGYAQGARDRRDVIASGAWMACMEALRSAESAESVAALHTYLHLSDYVAFYEDFIGMHPEFWNPDLFRLVLKHLPSIIKVPDNIEADEWALRLPDIEAAIKSIFCFILFWTAKESGERFSFEVAEAFPLLNTALDAIERNDPRFGTEIGAKVRGDALEEMIRVCGLLTQLSIERIDSMDEGEALAAVQHHAIELMHVLVRMLKLKIPTCGSKPEAITEGPIPVDERQQDSEWIQNLFERLPELEEPPVKTTVLMEVFRSMVDMSLEEQRYRLECLAPLVPRMVGLYAEQLKQKTVPPELADLKIVMNSVLQDDVATFAIELLEEVSFYPCLLDFTTKRAMIHAQCDRVRLTQGAGEPIRIVVPRDNVLDGVCSTLNLQDAQARIDAPLEIEFRAGYSDDTGNELVEDGEDQGGPRRQWMDRACRYFIASDLFMSPSEDAAHLEMSNDWHRGPLSRGRIVVPSPDNVCQCVQEDWTEQFELFGCVIGFAILHKETIPVHFGHNFLRSVFGLKTDTDDLLPLVEQVDKTLHTKLTYILSGSYRDLGDSLQDVLEQSHLPQTFVVSESHCQELVQSTPLIKDGESIKITESNKEQFVHLLLDRILVSGVAKQVNFFQRGLLRVVPRELVQRITGIMTVKEIELMLCGADGIDVDDWEKHTEYENGYTKDSQAVRWFWEAVREMPAEMRACLLSFSTGSSQVPSGGFRFLQPELFTIQRVGCTDRYPAAHTCANTLDLPEYKSKEVLEQYLRFALEETGDSFGLR